MSSWRFRLGLFLVRMWRWCEQPRLNLPLAVFLNRFWAPLWVLIL